MIKNKIKFQSMDPDTFYSMIEESEQAYQKNEVITHQELSKEVRSWVKK